MGTDPALTAQMRSKRPRQQVGPKGIQRPLDRATEKKEETQYEHR